jgi:hypothetical protein
MNRDSSTVSDLLKDFDPNKLTSDVISLGEQWADEDAAASSLEETRKTILAQIQLEYTLEGLKGIGADKPKPMPVSQAEMRALADPRYEQHVELMVMARKESNRCRVRYDMGKMRLELYRSLQATMRQEMNMLR